MKNWQLLVQIVLYWKIFEKFAFQEHKKQVRGNNYCLVQCYKHTQSRTIDMQYIYLHT